MKNDKRTRLIAVYMIALTALSVHATTWYFNVGEDKDNNGGIGVLTPAKWVDDGANPATAFSATDTYMVRGNNRLLLSKTTSFTGGPIYFGDLSYGGTKAGRARHNAVAMSFPNGVHFDSGNYQVNIYVQNDDSKMRDSSLAASRIDVGASASEPFQFTCRPTSGTDFYNHRRLLIDAPLYSGDGAGLLVGGMADSSAGSTNFTVALLRDCSGYNGHITVKPRQDLVKAFGDWDTCLMLSNITVSGTVHVFGGSSIEAREAIYRSSATALETSFKSGNPTECTVGTLDLKANSVILVWGNTTTPTNGIIHVRDSLSVEAPVAVRIKYDPRLSSTNKITILTAPASSALNAADFVPRVDSDRLVPYCDLVVENDAAANTKSLVAVFEPTVWQDACYSTEKAIDMEGSGSSLTNAAAWSDNLVPHSGAHYYMHNEWLRTLVDQESDYAFPGLSLTQEGGRLIIFTKSFRVPEYHALNGANIFLGQGTLNPDRMIVVDRFVADAGSVRFSAHQGKTLTVQGELSGAADLVLGGVDGTSAADGNYRFMGLNTNFTGNITVSQQEKRSGKHTFEKYFQTLYVEDGRNLGGAKAAFDEKALTLTDMSRLAVTNADVTLASGLNRGLNIEWIGRLYVEEPGSLTVNWPVRMNGTLYKEGTGTLALGGDVTVVDGQSADATNRTFVVTNGYVKALSADCVNGLTMSFAQNNETGLKLDYTVTDANLAQYGFRNVATDSPFVGDSIDVIVENVCQDTLQASQRRKLGLVTVKTTAADSVAARLNVRRSTGRSIPVVCDDDAETGTTTFSATFKLFFVVTFR